MICWHSIIINYSVQLDAFPKNQMIGAFYTPILESMEEWIIANCKGEVQKGSWDGLYGEELEVLFSDPKEALMFKLAWC